ncbi:hypothetical protein COT51_04175 [candidate division WWE3 bacterium CG08_land_8_20_14_0_20_41_15]|uniref:Right handed beta helix domain-containing protein n=1 Tax=candidate division WWE3 bacterium CG08_land_8_20_14_0_20_41_15 TaxID=1975086 RepID=A0A2H0XAI9_UNCKA|nr:MAG: hypothetical protein COT51_04175 [candidate division WWE3 bacterium CG08_land_8_20_14_0_20_41_15]
MQYCLRLFINGGRDNIVANNVFVDTINETLYNTAFLHDVYGDTPPAGMVILLNAMPHQNTLWTNSYPELPNILNEGPRGNKFLCNVRYGTKAWNPTFTAFTILLCG